MDKLNAAAYSFLGLGKISGIAGVACAFSTSNAVYHAGGYLLTIAALSLTTCVTLCFANMQRQDKEVC